MTDWEGYATVLAEKFSYENTFLHQEPRIDISAPEVPSERCEASDFIISSEVLEHVAPPVQRAFRNIWQLLKPGGVLILTAPYGTNDSTIEHFPELHQFHIVEVDGSFHLRNVTENGVTQEFKDLRFHGGPGSTLEMRIFSEKALIAHLNEAGFSGVKVHREPDLTHGVWWPEPWAFPIAARKSAPPY